MHQNGNIFLIYSFLENQSIRDQPFSLYSQKITILSVNKAKKSIIDFSPCMNGSDPKTLQKTSQKEQIFAYFTN